MTVWAELAAPWQVALEQAWGAYRAGSLPIGAAIADRVGRIVGRGRNRIFETLAEPPEARCLFGHRLAHAEMNALASLDHQAINPRECILYTTLEPCALCVGAIRMIGIKHVRYAARDPAAGGLALLEATDFMRRGRVVEQALGQPDLEAATIALAVAAHLELVSGWRPERWQAAGVPGVELGCRLFAAGALRRLADAGDPIEQVLDQLLGDPRLLAAEPPVRPAAELRAAPAVAPEQQAAAAQAGRRPLVLLITGAPASGKTTLGRPLAAALGLPYFSKDLFKETLFDSLGWQDRNWSRRLGGASMALLFRAAEALLAAGQSVALESNFYPTWDTPQLRALGERYACRFIQVVCTAPGPTLVERFERRARSGERHPGHADAGSLAEILPRLLAERWDALELEGPVFTVDTAEGVVDLDGLVHRIRLHLDDLTRLPT